jgi:hypothetical protein
MLGTNKGLLAIRQPEFKKIESDTSGGLVRISQRINLIDCELVMCYKLGETDLKPGDKVIIRGDSGLKPWAKTLFSFEENSFVLCPENEIIGYKIG